MSLDVSFNIKVRERWRVVKFSLSYLSFALKSLFCCHNVITKCKKERGGKKLCLKMFSRSWQSHNNETRHTMSMEHFLLLILVLFFERQNSICHNPLQDAREMERKNWIMFATLNGTINSLFLIKKKKAESFQSHFDFAVHLVTVYRNVKNFTSNSISLHQPRSEQWEKM